MNLGLALALLLFVQPNLQTQIVNGLLDDTFSGIYRLSAFDWMLLIPYFAVLVILSVYGIHRYETIRRYRKSRQNLLIMPPSYFSRLPRVTVQLPLFNERYVVERLLEEVCKLDYPRELLQIQVLDDSTDETHAFTERLCNEYQSRRSSGRILSSQKSLRLQGRCFTGRTKDGNRRTHRHLRCGFSSPADFLQRTVHFFTDPNVGVVQTRWSYLNKEFNILTQVEAMLLDGHFVLEHGSRCGCGLFFNFNGTAGVLAPHHD